MRILRLTLAPGQPQAAGNHVYFASWEQMYLVERPSPQIGGRSYYVTWIDGIEVMETPEQIIGLMEGPIVPSLPTPVPVAKRVQKK